VPVRRINEPADKEEDIYRGKALFMEPLTHRLTTFGIPADCSHTFYAKYKNAVGNWVTVTPIVREAIEPKPFYQVHTPRPSGLKNETDYMDPGAGIYPYSEMLALELQRTEGDRAQWTNVQLARQLMGSTHGMPVPRITQDDLLPMMPGPAKWAKDQWNKIAEFLQLYGHACAVIVGTFAVFKTINVILLNVFACVTMAQTFSSCTTRILGALCPSIFLLYQFAETRRGRKNQDIDGDEERRPLRDQSPARIFIRRRNVDRVREHTDGTPTNPVDTAAALRQASRVDLALGTIFAADAVQNEYATIKRRPTAPLPKTEETLPAPLFPVLPPRPQLSRRNSDSDYVTANEIERKNVYPKF
jgi:hypothetical protein